MPSPLVKVAPHVHSDWSPEGSLSLDRIAALFARKRCRAVLLAETASAFTRERFDDYVAACERASSGGACLVPGIEYASIDDRFHFLVWGLNEFLQDLNDPDDLLPEVARRGGIAVLAHPVRKKAWLGTQPHWVRHLAGVEVWNRRIDGRLPARESLTLARQTRLAPFVGLDMRTKRQAKGLRMGFPLLGEVTAERIVHCMHRAKTLESSCGALPLKIYCRGWLRSGVSAVGGVQDGVAGVFRKVFALDDPRRAQRRKAVDGPLVDFESTGTDAEPGARTRSAR